ncbi:hypothetical protein GTR02_17365 [Kineococcus sp. R8]|uniref:hypothetical protein n=1 Tax=Kineococcus siccus TaxID=2696567 RepID=UPI0014126EEE|nr:hypothetical protein [Kineococcus siccus]NAZ83584.1 hypothetical protein [Kineococcus siccus]
MIVRRVTAVSRTRLAGFTLALGRALLVSVITGARWGARQARRTGRALRVLLRHPRTCHGMRLALLIALMLANAAATWHVNNQTWAAGVLAVTNGANTLLLIISILDWHRNIRN